ncbi:endonuclease/exonuclease/phosphatase family protein [Thermomonospora amylolytica]|uniref:endonuclease/exonuclease/phosphatase family protein n=1 Tax=Thermomonospora amylolytica TaxID=1411117 RepID=UPI001F228866|nr:endonuclease/exonuclease/phosphatase family protein [Thermomonospora amylolytica]
MTFLRVLTGVPFAVAAVCAAGAVTAPAAAAAPAPVRQVHDIQGAAHVSPLLGERVTGVPGVVTAATENGFWMQGTRPDRDPATSEGVYVFTRTPPVVAAGDEVRVDGVVGEFRPGGPDSPNLSRTEIEATATTLVRRGAPLPAPTVLGPRGRRAPGEVIDDDVRGDAETSGRYEPGRDGLDFYESLEGMLVAVDDAVATGPRSDYGEIPVLPAGGEGAGPRTYRGGILARPGDANPERVVLDDTLLPLPAMDAGDRLPGRTLGVLDYSFGDYKLLATSVPRVGDESRAPGRARPQQPGEVAVATYALRDLDPGDPEERFTAIAHQIVTGLAAPDLLVVTGLQDNSGPDADGTVAADQTVAQLVAAISTAGGPAYDWRSIDPQDGADGGEAGGNGRIGFLFRTDRGLAFVDRPGGTATTPTAPVRVGAGEAGLSASPGRVDPLNPAWRAVRKPLAGEFVWRGRRLLVVGNHWTARGADDAGYVRRRPPLRPSEPAHAAQARVVAGFVKSLRAVQPDARVIVAGDLNSGDRSPALRTLTKDAGLRNLVAELPEDRRYTTITNGNAQATDHILVSPALARRPHEVEIVHMNAEYAGRVGDHDPALVRLRPD